MFDIWQISERGRHHRASTAYSQATEDIRRNLAQLAPQVLIEKHARLSHIHFTFTLGAGISILENAPFLLLGGWGMSANFIFADKY
jgi:hypothetical protein